MSNKHILILGMSLILYRCDNMSNVKDQAKQSSTQQETIHEEESHTLEFDNGKKWKVDENMLIHIRNMENYINEFASSKSLDYHTLSTTLQDNIELLTSNCTMKGKAHDELHKWLLPYIELVDELHETEDAGESEKCFENIQSLFKTFNQYFE
ncbi:MAG: hypothetical protein HOP11_13385 [Saprospiraceae bacterium]|nr:hypothetical protein [Saprospiraceae bacterium]